MDEHAKKIEKLKRYFTNRDDVVMAFVFGSQAEGRSHAGSDWDVAVYFTPTTGAVEWEEHDRDYPEEDRVWSDISRLLETDNVDLIVLNRAPASIAETAMRGAALTIKDEWLRLKLMRILTGAAEEYRRFVKDFYELSQRSRSLTDRDREDLIRTMVSIEEQMGLYDVYRQFTQKEFEEEPRKRNEVQHWLESMMIAAVDIAKIVLGSKRRLIPSSYRESVASANRTLGISDDVAENLDRWAKLRNILTHEYLDIKWKRISEFIAHSEPCIRQYLDAAKRFSRSVPHRMCEARDTLPIRAG